jgi:hypothetical protein
VAADVERAGVFGPLPDLKMAAAQLTTSPRPWSAFVFSGGWWAELVLGVTGGNPWLPTAATMSTALRASYSFLKATSRFAPSPSPTYLYWVKT